MVDTTTRIWLITFTELAAWICKTVINPKLASIPPAAPTVENTNPANNPHIEPDI